MGNRANRASREVLSEKVVWQLIKPYAEAAGVPGIAPHDLRRTCAKLCRAGGGELEQIQMLLGHASVQNDGAIPGDQTGPGSRAERCDQAESGGLGSRSSRRRSDVPNRRRGTSELIWVRPTFTLGSQVFKLSWNTASSSPFHANGNSCIIPALGLERRPVRRNVTSRLNRVKKSRWDHRRTLAWGIC
jgi:hypothetical protein